MSTPENESNGVTDPGEAATEAADSTAAEVSDSVVSPEQLQVRQLEAEIEQATKSAQEAQARLRTVSKAYTELQKDFKSFRERQESLRESIKKDQAFSLAKTFFDPVMNLKRSLQSLPEELSEAPFVSGLRMVNHQFMDSMSKLGLEEVPGEGARFDPNLHEALAVTPVSDPEQDGLVLTVHSVGYAVNGQALQPAQVVVAKYQATSEEEA